MKLFQPDPFLPGVECLLDVQKFANLTGINQPITIKDVRYKPRTSCLVTYRVGAEYDSSQPTWVHAKAFRSDDWPTRRTNIVRNFPNRSEVPLFDELAVALFTFPHDSELPAIGRLFEDPDEFLKRVIAEPIGTVSAISVLAYKPNRRLTAKIDMDRRRSFVLKLCEIQRFESVDRKLRVLSANDLNKPRRLGHSHRHGAIIFDWIEGSEPDLATLKDGQIESFVKRLSAFVDSFHNFQIKPSALFKSNTETRLSSLGRNLSELVPPIADVAIKAVNRLESLLEYYKQTSLIQECFVHGDFHPRQILVRGQQIAVCDFDNCRLDDPASDWGNFLAHVEFETFCGQFPASKYLFISKQVFSLPQFQDPDRQNILELMQLVSLFRLVTSAFRSGFENWVKITESIVTSIDDRSRHLARHELKTRDDLANRRCTQTCSIRQSILDDERFSFLYDCLSVAKAQDVIPGLFDSKSALQNALVVDVMARRHKPGRRCLIEFCLESQNGSNFAILGKASAKKLKRKTMLHQQSLHDTYGFGSDSEDAISVPRTRGIVKKWNMWFQDWIDARTCGELCDSDNTSGVPVRIAAAIWKLHSCQYDPGRDHRIFDEMAILTDRLKKYQQQVPENERRIERIIGQCADLCAGLEPAESVLLHRDFYHDQMLMTDDRTWLIDLDLIAKGHPGIDVGNFRAHLTELGLRRHGNPDHYRRFEDELLITYRRLNPNCSSRSIQICETLSLARHIYVSYQFNDRRQITEAIITLVEHRLKLCASHRIDSVP